MCPIQDNLNIEIGESIKPGEYNFLINDLNIPEGEFKYIHFELIEKETNTKYNNILSIAVPEKTSLDNSRFFKVLNKFNFNLKLGDKVNTKLINSLIGVEFKALVALDDGNYPKIEIDSILIGTSN